MKVLVSGGHFSPAYSLIKDLIKRGDKVAIAGRKDVFEGDNSESYEYIVAKKENIPFFEIRAGRLQRKWTRHTMSSFFRIALGFFDSIRVILRFKPDVVVAFGGYISFPISYAAFLYRIPVVLHEQTQKAGFAGRLVGIVANRICISFESSKKYFSKKKTVFTGNPIREEIFLINGRIQIKKEKPVIYITGGSSGSHIINLLVKEILTSLLSEFIVIHQVGGNKFYNDYQLLEEKRQLLPHNLKEKYILRKFIYPEEIGDVLNSADLVICRAGINTVVELLALGKTCLLIPLSHGQVNEQLDNAKLVKDAGIGDYIEEKNVTSTLLLKKIEEMIRNKKNYEINKEKVKDYLVTNATQRITKVIEEVYAKKSN